MSLTKVINLFEKIQTEILCVQIRKNRCVSSVKLSITLPQQPNTSHYCYKKESDRIRIQLTLLEIIELANCYHAPK